MWQQQDLYPSGGGVPSVENLGVQVQLVSISHCVMFLGGKLVHLISIDPEFSSLASTYQV
jgi:hypothetical protein